MKFPSCEVLLNSIMLCIALYHYKKQKLYMTHFRGKWTKTSIWTLNLFNSWIRIFPRYEVHSIDAPYYALPLHISETSNISFQENGR